MQHTCVYVCIHISSSSVDCIGLKTQRVQGLDFGHSAPTYIDTTSPYCIGTCRYRIAGPELLTLLDIDASPWAPSMGPHTLNVPQQTMSSYLVCCTDICINNKTHAFIVIMITVLNIFTNISMLICHHYSYHYYGYFHANYVYDYYYDCC